MTQIKELSFGWGEQFGLISVVLLVGLSAFGLGRLSTLEANRPAITTYTQEMEERAPRAIGGFIVASRRGTKYHFPWCTGARAMNEENKVWFSSIEEAKNAGYTPAGNCKGLD